MISLSINTLFLMEVRLVTIHSELCTHGAVRGQKGIKAILHPDDWMVYVVTFLIPWVQYFYLPTMDEIYFALPVTAMVIYIATKGVLSRRARARTTSVQIAANRTRMLLELFSGLLTPDGDVSPGCSAVIVERTIALLNYMEEEEINIHAINYDLVQLRKTIS